MNDDIDDFDYFPFVPATNNDAWDDGGPCFDDYDDGVDDLNYIVTGCNDDD